MREKLLDLMKNEGLKPSRLAEILGINPAGISHILAGRNKPGFDLLQKILLRFPRISPDWLLLDKGPMYRDAASSGIASTPSSAEPTESPSDTPAAKSGVPADNLFTSLQSTEPPASAKGTSVVPPASQAESHATKIQNRTTAVKRVVIFYEDNSFEAYFPTMR